MSVRDDSAADTVFANGKYHVKACYSCCNPETKVAYCVCPEHIRRLNRKIRKVTVLS